MKRPLVETAGICQTHAGNPVSEKLVTRPGALLTWREFALRLDIGMIGANQRSRGLESGFNSRRFRRIVEIDRLRVGRL